MFGGITAATAAVKTITDVEMGMTQIARITEDATFNFQGMRNELMGLGREYGMVWDTVQDIAVKWAQAGYNVSDTLELTKTSLLALNTAELDSTYATQGLIAIMAQWNMTADQLLPTIDKINKTADDWAVSSQDLVDGLNRSSGAAKVMGLTLEQAIAVLTVMREATGRTGKEVGNALNSILSFMQRDTALKAFAREGIAVWADEARTQFRNVIDIFDDLSKRWQDMPNATRDMFVQAADQAGLYSEELAELAGTQKEFNDLQQRDLSQAMAGIYRRNYLLALLQNWTKIDQVLIGMEDSLGYSMRENERTMQTLEKQYTSLKVAAQELAVAIGDAGLLTQLKEVVEGARDAITWFNELDPTLRNLIITFTEATIAAKLLGAAFKMAGVSGVASLLTGWAVPITATTASARVLATTLTGLTAVATNAGKALLGLFGGPWGLGFTLGTTAIIASVNATRQAEKEHKEYLQTMADTQKQYDELGQKILATTLNTDEHRKAVENLRDMQTELGRQYPELIKNIDAEAMTVELDMDKVKKLAEEHENLKNKVEASTDAFEKQLEAYQKDIQESNQRILEYEKEASRHENNIDLLQELIDYRNKHRNAAKDDEAAQKEAGQVEEGIIAIVGEAGYARLEAAGFTKEAINIEIEALKEKAAEVRRAAIAEQEWQISQTNIAIGEAQKRINALKEEAEALRNFQLTFWQAVKAMGKSFIPEPWHIGDTDIVSSWRRAYDQEVEKMTVAADKEAADAAAEGQALQDKLQSQLNALDELKARAAEGVVSGSPGYVGEPGGKKEAAKETDDWLQKLIDSTLQYAEAQRWLNTVIQQEIDGAEVRIAYYRQGATTVDEYVKALADEDKLMGLLTQKQEGLHLEADAYRVAIAKLEEAQSKVNVSTEEGREAYEKLDDVIKEHREHVAKLGIEWWRVRDAQQALIDQNYGDYTSWLDELRDFGRLSLEEQFKYLERIDLSKLSLQTQSDVAKRLRDSFLEITEEGYQKEIKAVEAAEEAFKQASNAKIAALEEQLDKLDEQNEALREQQRIEEALEAIDEARSDLRKAREKLANVQAEKDTRILQDGLWTYIANPQAVRDAQDAVDKANEKLADAQKSHDELMEELYQESIKKKLEAQIAAEKEAQKLALEAYDKQEEDLEDHLRNLEDSIRGKGVKLNDALGDVLDDLGQTMESKLRTMAGKVDLYTSQIEANIRSMISAASSYEGFDFLGPQYASGGPIYADHLAKVHAGEYMLNAQNVRLLGGMGGVERLLASIKMPSFDFPSRQVSQTTYSTSKSTVDQSITLSGPINLPHVYDVSGFIRNLRQLVRS